MKKIITYLSLACMSTLGFGQTTIEHDWAGMIKNGEHLGVSGMESDDDGNSYVVMTIKGNADFDLTTTGVSTADYSSLNGGVIVKYDKDGELVWKNTFEGSDNRSYNVALASNGDVVVSGVYKSSFKVNGVTKFTGGTTWDGYVVKFKADGTYLSGVNFPTTGDTYIYGLEVDAQHNIYISGYGQSEMDLDTGATTLIVPSNGYNTGFVAKYDANYNVQWGVSMAGTIQRNVYNRAVTVDDDNVYVGGYGMKYGQMDVKKIGSTNVVSTTVEFAPDGDGHIVVINKSTGAPKHIETIKSIDTFIGNRARVFDVEYSAVDDALVAVSDYSGMLEVDGDTILGNTYDSKRAGLIQKFHINATGDLLTKNWSQSLISNTTSNNGAMTIRDISIDQTNGKIATASASTDGIFGTKYEGDVITDSTLLVYSNFGLEAFSIVFDKEGELVRAFMLGSDALSLGQVVNINDNVVITGGWFRGYVSLDHQAQANFDGGSTNSIGLTQFTITEPIVTSLNKNNNKDAKVSVYPNPASDRVSINIDDVINVSVLNTKGETLLETKENNFDVSILKTGVYALRIETQEGVFVQKLVKQ